MDDSWAVISNHISIVRFDRLRVKFMARVFEGNILVLLCDYLYKPKEPHKRPVPIDV
jgi:ABC-type enterochelin transport system permease subunit